MHHGCITLYDREEDDISTFISFMEPDNGRTRSGGDYYSSDDFPGSQNPSDRRGGIVISFSCEICGDDLEFTIAQHSGRTIVAWQYPDQDAEGRSRNMQARKGRRDEPARAAKARSRQK